MPGDDDWGGGGGDWGSLGMQINAPPIDLEHGPARLFGLRAAAAVGLGRLERVVPCSEHLHLGRDSGHSVVEHQSLVARPPAHRLASSQRWICDPTGQRCVQASV